MFARGSTSPPLFHFILPISRTWVEISAASERSEHPLPDNKTDDGFRLRIHTHSLHRLRTIGLSC